MNPGTTLALSWLPERGGNWVFHCHFPFHVSSHMGMPRDSAERSAEPWLIAASGGNATGHSDGRTESPHAQGESASAHVEVTPVVAHGDGAQPVAPTNNRSTSADRNPASAYDPRPTSAQVEAAPASAHTQGGAKAAHPMGGLVLGIHVTPGATPEPRRPGGQPREIRLLAQSSPHRYGAIRGMGYVVQEGGAEPARDSIDVPGPALVLRRGQPVRLTVVNHLAEPTAVHWHGIELESWADGVPGWSGNAAQVMPPIQPGDSFVAEFVPPRAGTYIYHTHSNEQLQMGSGLYGPLLVVDPARPYDPETDKVFIVGGAGPADSLPQFGYQSPGLVNGSDTPSPLDLEVGRTYRLRMININPDWRVIFSLTSASALQRWRPVAKDGADLPASQRTPRPAWLLTGPGETADFEFTPLVRGDLRLEVKTLLPGWIVPVTVRVR
jgi:FtsP/CotA-like multicopper oxidase with cupredoxin domain